MEDKIRSQFLQGFMSLYNGTLRNFCKHDKIRDIVKARGIEDYEPSYKGLKLLAIILLIISPPLRTFL